MAKKQPKEQPEQELTLEQKLDEAYQVLSNLLHRVTELEGQSVVYNNSIVALAMGAGTKAKSFKDIKPDEFKAYVIDEMRPFVKNVMEIAGEVNKKMQEEEDAKREDEEADDKEKSTDN